jgi:hypothetical protein
MAKGPVAPRQSRAMPSVQVCPTMALFGNQTAAMKDPENTIVPDIQVLMEDFSLVQ